MATAPPDRQDADETEAERDVANDRRCIVTRDSGPREGLIRFGIAPDGVVVPDLAEQLPGRGLWLTARRDIVAAAVAKRAFGRAARRSVTVPEDLPDRIAGLLADRCGRQLGLAQKAGLVAAGHQAAEDAVRRHAAMVLFVAADSDGRDGRELAARVRRAGNSAVCRLLTAAELGAALGRAPCVHVAVAPGRLTEELRRDCNRLAGFRDEPEGAAD